MLAQQIVNGLTLGAVYTLIALSFSLVMGILSILNLAIGELFMLGGYIGFSVIAANFPLPVALLAGMAAGALTAIIIGKIACEPLRDAPPITPLLSTLGFSIILQNVVTNVWGSDPLQLPSELFDDRLTLDSLNVGVMQLAVIGVTIILVGALAWLIQSTSAGRALRAVAENREVARLLGVSVGRMMMRAFAISGALAGAAGVLISLHYAAITPYVGVDTGLKAIAVMVIGGTANVWGALLAGPLIGIAEVLTVAYGGSQMRDFVVYGLMILILLLRPQGLLGDETAAGLVGLNTTLIKVGAFGIGAAIAGALLRRPSAIRSEWRGQDDAVQRHIWNGHARSGADHVRRAEHHPDACPCPHASRDGAYIPEPCRVQRHERNR
jgi:branched-chain amino acid transport system permease protein